MAKVANYQSNFTGGELSPRLDGRVDVTKFKNGLRVCENMTVLPHGGARKRSGSQFILQQPTAEDVVLVPFQYNTEQAYVLMFGPGYVWFFKDRGIITYDTRTITGITQANPAVVTTSGSHNIAAGEYVILTGVGGMAELNNRIFVAGNTTATTFQLQGVDSTAYTAYTSGGTAAEIVALSTPYTASELPDLTFAQAADTLFVAHRSHPIRKITRQGHTAWALSAPGFTTGPFRTINSERASIITCSGFSASATTYGTHIVGTTFTMTCASAIFDDGMVAALFRLNEEGGATGIESAPVGDSGRAIAGGDVYTNEGNVYGVYAVSGATTWLSFTRVPAHEAGTVRVRGESGHYFDSDFLHPGYCVVKITGFISSTQVTAQIVRYQMPKTIVDSGTSFWEEGAWSGYRGYPRAIAFYEQRLFLAGSDSDPQVLWGSRSNAYEDFEDGADDDDALTYRISSGSADVIRWLQSGRVLTAGSSLGEFAIAASNQNEALTPKNFKASPQTSYGTSKCPPIRVNQSVLYPQRAGKPENAAKKLREFSYAYESDSFNSVDITVFSEHIFGPGISRLAYQLEPDSIIWARRTDGQLAACTYERLQEVIAWHRHKMGGTNAAVQTQCVIPGDDGDEVWLSVQRTVSGQTVRYIEVFHPAFADDASKEDAKFVDAMLTYSGSSTSTISGLWHLRGETVKVLNNGSVETATVSSTGRVTLARATTKAHIGLPYTAILETEDFEAGAQAGTAQSRAKRISQIYVRLLNSLGGSYGPDADNLKPMNYRTAAMPHGTSPPLYSGLKELDHPGGWERYARVRFEHSDPLPFHITGIVAELNVTG
jgi:hypothetical protein